jgi:nucleoside-diphosphate-sugar epimerase
MAKVACEQMANAAGKASGRFDVISICPSAVLGPLLSPIHELVGSWQWHLGRMLAGKPCTRSWSALWNCVDVRDVAAAEILALESERCSNGDRYQLTATDPSGELNVLELQAHLSRLFPDIDVGGPPPEYDEMVRRQGGAFDAPRAYCRKAREELGLETHPIEETLRATGETMIALGLVQPKRRPDGHNVGPLAGSGASQ